MNSRQEELLAEFLSQAEVDFGYSVGNLNMDTTAKSRRELVEGLKSLVIRACLEELIEVELPEPVIKDGRISYAGPNPINVRIYEFRMELNALED